MTSYQDALAHGQIQEVLKDIFFVTGTMKNEFFGSNWHFSRNMTIVRENGKLTIFNSVRLDEPGLAQLEGLGEVANVVRLGDMHGVDDPFYVNRYNAKFWALPGMSIQEGLQVDKEMTEDGELPISDASLFVFKTVQRPECIIRLDRDGGVMIACDSLQNWVGPNEFFDEETVNTMQKMNFFKPANLGPAWMHGSQPQAADFVRLKKIPFKHVLCAHGEPLLDNAEEAFHKTFDQLFNL